MKSELEKLYTLIEDLETAMMTTRRPDGHLQSRAMANQKRAEGADLWFVTAVGSRKLADLAHDPHVNLSYYRDSNREWVSVSGLATLSRDRNKIRELYASDWSVWFPDDGDPQHGTPDDPRMVLIGVAVHAAVFLDVTKPRPVLLYEFIKGWLTGTEPDLGEMHEVESQLANRNRDQDLRKGAQEDERVASNAVGLDENGLPNDPTKIAQDAEGARIDKSQG